MVTVEVDSMEDESSLPLPLPRLLAATSPSSTSPPFSSTSLLEEEDAALNNLIDGHR